MCIYIFLKDEFAYFYLMLKDELHTLTDKVIRYECNNFIQIRLYTTHATETVL